jgi:hypothetical protein
VQLRVREREPTPQFEFPGAVQILQADQEPQLQSIGQVPRQQVIVCDVAPQALSALGHESLKLWGGRTVLERVMVPVPQGWPL